MYKLLRNLDDFKSIYGRYPKVIKLTNYNVDDSVMSFLRTTDVKLVTEGFYELEVVG